MKHFLSILLLISFDTTIFAAHGDVPRAREQRERAAQEDPLAVIRVLQETQRHEANAQTARNNLVMQKIRRVQAEEGEARQLYSHLFDPYLDIIDTRLQVDKAALQRAYPASIQWKTPKELDLYQAAILIQPILDEHWKKKPHDTSGVYSFIQLLEYVKQQKSELAAIRVDLIELGDSYNAMLLAQQERLTAVVAHSGQKIQELDAQHERDAQEIQRLAALLDQREADDFARQLGQLHEGQQRMGQNVEILVQMGLGVPQ